jgi:hypothetical protein
MLSIYVSVVDSAFIFPAQCVNVTSVISQRLTHEVRSQGRVYSILMGCQG